MKEIDYSLERNFGEYKKYEYEYLHMYTAVLKIVVTGVRIRSEDDCPVWFVLSNLCSLIHMTDSDDADTIKKVTMLAHACIMIVWKYTLIPIVIISEIIQLINTKT